MARQGQPTGDCPRGNVWLGLAGRGRRERLGLHFFHLESEYLHLAFTLTHVTNGGVNQHFALNVLLTS